MAGTRESIRYQSRRWGTAWACFFLWLWSSGSAAALQVTLPLDLYEDLRARAFPEDEPAPKPPALLTFEEARLQVRVGEHSAKLSQRLTVSLLDERWHEVSLPAAGTFVAADLGSAEGFLKAEEGWLLRLRGRGQHQLTLESAVPTVKDEDAARPTARLTFALPDAAWVGGELMVPPWVEEVQLAKVYGGSAPNGVLQPAGGGVWKFLGRPGGRLEFLLLGAPQAPERDHLPLAFEATSASVVKMGRTRREVEAWVKATVLQGELEKLSLSLPEGMRVVAVEGAAVAGWKAEGSTLWVTPLEATARELRFRVELTGPTAMVFSSPVLVPEGAVRRQYFSKASVLGDGLLEWTDPGSSRVEFGNVEDLPEAFQQAEGLQLRLLDGADPPRWRISWSEGVEVLAAKVERVLVDVLVGEAGEAFYQMWIEAESRGVTTLEVTPPEGFRLVSSRKDGATVQPGERGRALAFPLSAGEGRQTLFVSGHIPLALPESRGEIVLAVPSFSVPVAAVEVRFTLPGSCGAWLVDATRLGRVGPPPSISRPGEASTLAALLRRTGTSSAGGLAAQGGHELLPTPDGYQRLEAVWSALTPTPSPLVVAIPRSRTKRRWF